MSGNGIFCLQTNKTGSHGSITLRRLKGNIRHIQHMNSPQAQVTHQQFVPLVNFLTKSKNHRFVMFKQGYLRPKKVAIKLSLQQQAPNLERFSHFIRVEPIIIAQKLFKSILSRGRTRHQIRLSIFKTFRISSIF